MNQIACCDWLPERARWIYLARSGFLFLIARHLEIIQYKFTDAWERIVQTALR